MKKTLLIILSWCQVFYSLQALALDSSSYERVHKTERVYDGDRVIDYEVVGYRQTLSDGRQIIYVESNYYDFNSQTGEVYSSINRIEHAEMIFPTNSPNAGSGGTNGHGGSGPGGVGGNGNGQNYVGQPGSGSNGSDNGSGAGSGQLLSQPALVCVEMNCFPVEVDSDSNQDFESSKQEVIASQEEQMSQEDLNQRKKDISELLELAPNLNPSGLPLGLNFNSKQNRFTEDSRRAQRALTGFAATTNRLASENSAYYQKQRAKHDQASQGRKKAIESFKEYRKATENYKVESQGYLASTIGDILNSIFKNKEVWEQVKKSEFAQREKIYTKSGDAILKIKAQQAREAYQQNNFIGAAELLTDVFQGESKEAETEVAEIVDSNGYLKGKAFSDGQLTPIDNSRLSYQHRRAANLLQASTLIDLSSLDFSSDAQLLIAGVLYLNAASSASEWGFEEDAKIYVQAAQEIGQFLTGAAGGFYLAGEELFDTVVMLGNGGEVLFETYLQDPEKTKNILASASKAVVENLWPTLKKEITEAVGTITNGTSEERGELAGRVIFEVVTGAVKKTAINTAKVGSRSIEKTIAKVIKASGSNVDDLVRDAGVYGVKSQAGVKVFGKIKKTIDTLPEGLKPTRIREGVDSKKIAIIGRKMNGAVDDASAHFEKNGIRVQTFSDKDAWDNFVDIQRNYNLKNGLLVDTHLPLNEVVKTDLYKSNKAWAEMLKREGYTVIDLDDPLGATYGHVHRASEKMSPFYTVEKSILFGSE